MTEERQSERGMGRSENVTNSMRDDSGILVADVGNRDYGIA